MGIYENMGANLRLLSKQRGTITLVCKELGINRQQFTKYLNGENFPRRTTLKKICEYFAIEELDLFVEPNSKIVKVCAIDGTPLKQSVLTEVLEDLHLPQEVPVQDGLYLTYMRALQDPNWVVRSIVAVKTTGRRTEFRRLTGFAEMRTSPWRLSLGNHRGMVLSRRGVLYFLALDEYASKAPTLAVMQWTPTEIRLLKGQTIALSRSGASICHVVMEKLPKNLNLRQAIRKSGAIGVKDPEIPIHIKQVLHNM